MEFLNSLLPFGKSLALALLVAVAGWFLISRFVRILRRQLSRGKLDPTLRPFLVSLTDWGLKILLGIGVVGISNWVNNSGRPNAASPCSVWATTPNP